MRFNQAQTLKRSHSKSSLFIWCSQGQNASTVNHFHSGKNWKCPGLGCERTLFNMRDDTFTLQIYLPRPFTGNFKLILLRAVNLIHAHEVHIIMCMCILESKVT